MLGFGRAAALALVAVGLLANGAVASAQTSGVAKARFSDAAAYLGKPDLPLTSALLVAGGGPARFDAVTVVHALAGRFTDREVRNLTAIYGAANIKSFLDVFAFVAADTRERVAKGDLVLPTPDPDPTDGRALTAALEKDGVGPDGRYDVEYLLDMLLTHELHVRIMDDIDATYGRKADANFHLVFAQLIGDLKDDYKL